MFGNDIVSTEKTQEESSSTTVQKKVTKSKDKTEAKVEPEPLIDNQANQMHGEIK
jgi:hypothetical protein